MTNLWGDCITSRAEVIPRILCDASGDAKEIRVQDNEGIVYWWNSQGLASGDVNQAVAVVEGLNQTTEITAILGLLRRIAALEGGAK